MTAIEIFKELHNHVALLLLGNVWDAQSAMVYEKLGYTALATSSSAVVNSLGYKDGENMSFDDYFYVIKRIVKSVTILLTVDLESGYGKNMHKIVSNISKLAKIGIVGINIEDCVMVNDIKQIEDKNIFSKKLKSLILKLKEENIDVFVNLRTDPFLLGLENPLEETLQRIRLFEQSGIDGVFVPCVTSEENIKSIVEGTKLPVNVMAMPEFPDFKTLQTLGVKRISSGNFVHEYIYTTLEKKRREIIQENCFSPIL